MIPTAPTPVMPWCSVYHPTGDNGFKSDKNFLERQQQTGLAFLSPFRPMVPQQLLERMGMMEPDWRVDVYRFLVSNNA